MWRYGYSGRLPALFFKLLDDAFTAAAAFFFAKEKFLYGSRKIKRARGNQETKREWDT